MPISAGQWCVVHTQSRGEGRAEHNLRSQGYTLYAPVVWRKVRHARQLKTVQTALFPRYIFVRLDLDRDRWRNINATAGVSHLITIRDRPLPLPDGLVEALMAAHAPQLLRDQDAEFEVDKTVQLRGGPFADLIGRIESVDEGGRVQVLLEIMGRAVLVQTTLAHVSPSAERYPRAPSTNNVASAAYLR